MHVYLHGISLFVRVVHQVPFHLVFVWHVVVPFKPAEGLGETLDRDMKIIPCEVRIQPYSKLIIFWEHLSHFVKDDL